MVKMGRIGDYMKLRENQIHIRDAKTKGKNEDIGRINE